MRPLSILYFERLIFGTLFLGVIQSYLSWDRSIAAAAAIGNNPVVFMATTLIGTFAIMATLTLLVSRRRSKVAMWISVLFFVLGLPLFFKVLSSGILFGSGFISLLQTTGQLVAFSLLFTRSARLWMNGEDGASSELKDVFR
jgi:hypothetical protein